MQSLLSVELTQISTAERIQLAEDLWDSILLTPEALAITEPQKQELDHRLEQYRENHDTDASWQNVRERLTFNPQPHWL